MPTVVHAGRIGGAHRELAAGNPHHPVRRGAPRRGEFGTVGRKVGGASGTSAADPCRGRRRLKTHRQASTQRPHWRDKQKRDEQNDPRDSLYRRLYLPIVLRPFSVCGMLLAALLSCGWALPMTCLAFAMDLQNHLVPRHEARAVTRSVG